MRRLSGAARLPRLWTSLRRRRAWRGNNCPAIGAPAAQLADPKTSRTRHLALANAAHSHPDVLKFKPTALKLSKAYVTLN